MLKTMASEIRPVPTPQWQGDADVARIGTLIGETTRATLLLALSDGRALAATQLAQEAGVAASTASEHLAKLVDASLLQVEQHGRHRYYRLVDGRVAMTLEQLAQLAPPQPVRSLKQGTRAHAMRLARTCYDHLAGRLGVAIMAAMIERGALVGHDGTYDPAIARIDRLSSVGHDIEYRLTSHGNALLESLDIRVPEGRRVLVGYCVDWSEQRHHLRGRVGSALLNRLVELDWIRRAKTSRAVTLTGAGRAGLRDWLGLDFPNC